MNIKAGDDQIHRKPTDHIITQHIRNDTRHTISKEWDVGIITSLHKKDSYNCKNDKGISLLCTSDKIFENIKQNTANNTKQSSHDIVLEKLCFYVFVLNPLSAQHVQSPTKSTAFDCETNQAKFSTNAFGSKTLTVSHHCRTIFLRIVKGYR